MCLDNIKNELLTNEKLISDYGFEIHSRGADFVEKKNDVLFIAAGISQSVRGINYKGARPSMICCDDCDKEEISKNPQRVKELVKFFQSELIGCMPARMGRMVVIGNRFAQNMLLTEVSKMHNCYYLKMNALDENDKSTWENYHKTEFLLTKRNTLGPLAFGREFMNEPFTDSEIFPIEYLQWGEFPIESFDKVIFYLDASYSVSGDFKAVVILVRIDDKYYIYDMYVRKGMLETCLIWIKDQYLKLRLKYPILYYDGYIFGKPML